MGDERDKSSGKPAARPVIQLPSFREIQAAQRPAASQPNFFKRPPAASSNQVASPTVQATQPAHRPDNGQAASSTIAAPPSAGAHLGRGQAPSSVAYAPQGATASPYASNRGASGGASTTPVPPPPGPAVQGDWQGYDAAPNAILVSRKQEGNPVLKHMRSARWQFADIVPDYTLGANTCALFLSLRYHLLKPEYIHHRIRELQRSYRLRVLLCHVDVDDVVEPLAQVTRAALLNSLTLICAWSPEECARYLETYKIYETKPADAILGRTEEDYLSRLNAAMTTIRGVNKTDVLTLGATFKTAANIMKASMEEFSACPGIGPTKVRRLFETFHEPFRKTLQPQTAVEQAGAGVQSSGNQQQRRQAEADGNKVQQDESAAFQNLPMEDAMLDTDANDQD